MALLLSVVMLVSMLPVAALATQDAGYTAPVVDVTDGADGADGADADASHTDNDGDTVDDTDSVDGTDDADKTGDTDNDTDKTGDADDDTDTSADSTTAGALGAAPQAAATPSVQSVDTPSVRGSILDLGYMQFYIAVDGDVITDTDNSQKLPILLGVEISKNDDNELVDTTTDMTVTLKDYTANYQLDDYDKYDYSPVMVWPGSNVTLIIDGTVTLYGTNAKETSGATPAIYVPEDATLTIISAHETRQDDSGNALTAPVDTLKVYGGNAAAGGDGTSGTQYNESGYIYVGGGGYGGGGAAAAIGTGGGSGGKGSARTRYMQKYTYEGTQHSVYWYILPCGSTGIDFNDEGTNGTLRWVDASGNDVDVPKGATLVGDAITVDSDTRQDGYEADDAGSIRVVGYLTLEGSGGNAAAGGKGGAGGIAKVTVIRDVDTNDQSGYSYVYIAFPGCGGGGGGGGGCAASFIGTGGAGGSGGYRGEYKTFSSDYQMTIYGGSAMNADFSKGDYDKVSIKQPGLNGGNGGWPNGSGGSGGDGAYVNYYGYVENDHLYLYMTYYDTDYTRQTATAAAAGCVGNNGSAGYNGEDICNLENMPDTVAGGAGGTGAGGVNSETNSVDPTVMTQSPIFSTAVNVANNSVAAGITGSTTHHSVLVGSGDGYNSGNVTQTAPILLVDLKDCTINLAGVTYTCSCTDGHTFNQSAHAISDYSGINVDWSHVNAFCRSLVTGDGTANGWNGTRGYTSVAADNDLLNVPGAVRVKATNAALAHGSIVDNMSGAAALSAGQIAYVGYQNVPLDIEKGTLDSINFLEGTAKTTGLGQGVSCDFRIEDEEIDFNVDSNVLLANAAYYAATPNSDYAYAKGAKATWRVTKSDGTAIKGTDYTITLEENCCTFTPLKIGTYIINVTLDLDNYESISTTTATSLAVTAQQDVTPTITGTPHAGQTLTASLPADVLAALKADDITVSYQWGYVTTDESGQILTWDPISGATAATYTVPHNCTDGKMAVSIDLSDDTYYQEGVSDPIAVTAHSYDNGFCTVKVGKNEDESDILCDEYEPANSYQGVYRLTDAGQLFWFAALTNGDSTHAHMADGTPVSQNLAANAQIAGYKAFCGISDRSWTPIAKAAKVENGTLTGGYTGTIELANNVGLLNVNIDYSEATSDTAPQCVGFIAALGSGGTVKVPSPNSGTTTIAQSVKAKNSTYVGGLVGYAAAGSTIQFGSTPMQNKFEITADNCGYVGGVVGYSAGTLTNANFAGTITATGGSKNIGGVVGYADGITITNPSYTGVIKVDGASENIGGIVGCSNGATITGATAIGTYVGNADAVGVYNGYSGIIAVNGTDESAKCKEVGGIVGLANGATRITDATSSVKITGSYLSHVGGVLGAGRGGSVQLSGCLYNEYEKTDAYDWQTVDSNNISVTSTWDSVGGIAGVLEGTMVNSANRAYIKVNAGNRSDGVFVGGLAGQTGTDTKIGKITDCYSCGDIDVITTVTGADRAIGGLIGRCFNGSNGGCFNSYYREDSVFVADTEAALDALYDALNEGKDVALNQAIGVLNLATCPDTSLPYTPCRAAGGGYIYDEETQENIPVKGGFVGGEVTYLLNGKTSNAAENAWFQHLDDDWTSCTRKYSQTYNYYCSDHIADYYPRLAREFTKTSDHGYFTSGDDSESDYSTTDYSIERSATAVVYQNWQGTSGYSNSPVPYSVDVTWGSMVFEYEPGTWDPETHISTGGGWINTYEDHRNRITVNNNDSVYGIFAAFAFAKDEGFNYDLTGTFTAVDKSTMQLYGDKRYKIDAGNTGECDLTLNSTDPIPSIAFKTDGTANKKIGTVTVTLSEFLPDD